MKTDLSILFQEPTKDQYVVLTIDPLAPLSIVSTLPGSYYKSQNAPTKSNLCGMFENVLGWHIGPKERKAIFNKMKLVYKKSYKITDFEQVVSNVGYASLLGHLFDVELAVVPEIVTRYDDLWKQQLKHDDVRHLKGTPNLSYYLISQKRALPTDEKGKIKDSEYTKFLKYHYDLFPMYYTSPTPREFIVIEDPYKFKISINCHLLSALNKSIQENNIAYLGTNEGWVDLSIKEI